MRRSSLLPIPILRYLRPFDRSPLGPLWVVMTLSAGVLSVAPHLIVPIAAAVFFLAWHRATQLAKPKIERKTYALHAQDLSKVLASVATVASSLVLLFLGSKWWLLADVGDDATALLIVLGLGISAGLTLSVLMNWRLPLGFLALAAVFISGLWAIASSGRSEPIEIDSFSLLVRLLLVHAVAIVVDSLRYRHFRWSHMARSAWWMPAAVLASTYLLAGASKSVTHSPSPWWLAGMMAAIVLSVVWVARAATRQTNPSVGLAWGPMLRWASLPAFVLAPISSWDIWSLVFVAYALTGLERSDSGGRTRVHQGAKPPADAAKPKTQVTNPTKAASLTERKPRHVPPVILCLTEEK